MMKVLELVFVQALDCVYGGICEGRRGDRPSGSAGGSGCRAYIGRVDVVMQVVVRGLDVCVDGGESSSFGYAWL